MFCVFDDPYYRPQATPEAMARYYRGFYRNFSPELFGKLCKILEIDPEKRLHSFSKGMKRFVFPMEFSGSSPEPSSTSFAPSFS